MSDTRERPIESDRVGEETILDRTSTDPATRTGSARDAAAPPHPQAVSKMLRMVLGSWLLDATQLAVLAGLAGVDAWAAFWCLVIGGTVMHVTLSCVIALGWNRRLRDPSMTLPHLLAWSVMIVAGSAASPAIAVLALSTLFLAFTFATLRLRPSDLAWSWVCVGAGVAVLIATQPQPLTVPMATPLQSALSALWLSLMLGRCALLGLHSARLRQRLGERTRELAEATARLQHLATHDPLTGALNRGAIQDALEASLAGDASERPALPSVVLVDLDHFKSINDRFGHPVGDEVLRRFAGIVGEVLAPTDCFGRFGGEEFLLVLRSGDDVPTVGEVAERLCRHVRGHPWHEVSPDLSVSASMGVATARQGETLQSLLVRADEGLYRAKRLGRDRVQVADTDTGAGPDAGADAHERTDTAPRAIAIA